MRKIRLFVIEVANLMKGNLKSQFEKDGKLFENLIHIELYFKRWKRT